MIYILTSFYCMIISQMQYLCEFDHRSPCYFAMFINYKKSYSNTDWVELTPNDSEMFS